MRTTASFSVLVMLSMNLLSAQAQQATFGASEDQDFGNELWDVLVEKNFVGENAIMSMPYEGTDPHGSVLVTLESEVEVEGKTGVVIVKRNYGGDGATVDSVSDAPDEYLMAITVMFQREDFDAENQNWFWAKYMLDGSYDNAPNGSPMVGAVEGCISCHSEAGDDLVYLNDRYR